MVALGRDHNPEEWRLFIDFIDLSKLRLKAVLLHNGNVHPFIAVVYSVNMKETMTVWEIFLRF